MIALAKTTSCPFTVAIDTREQAPYSFLRMPATSQHRGKRLVIQTVYQTLNEGDYSIDGLQRIVAVERKSLEDLFGTLGSARQRFEAEIQRLQSYRFAAVVIEASWSDICQPARVRHNWRSRLHPRSVFETISSWEQKYPIVHWHAMGSRRLAEIKTFSILEKAWRHQQALKDAVA